MPGRHGAPDQRGWDPQRADEDEVQLEEKPERARILPKQRDVEYDAQAEDKQGGEREDVREQPHGDLSIWRLAAHPSAYRPECAACFYHACGSRYLTSACTPIGRGCGQRFSALAGGLTAELSMTYHP